MNCPHCNGKLEQETYYDYENEDTSYYNLCPLCGWDDRFETEEYYEEEETEFNCSCCPYHWADFDEDYPRCHYQYNDGCAPCELG